MIAVFLRDSNNEFIGTYEDQTDAFNSLKEFIDEDINRELGFDTILEGYEDTYLEIDTDDLEYLDVDEINLLKKANLI